MSLKITLFNFNDSLLCFKITLEKNIALEHVFEEILD